MLDRARQLSDRFASLDGWFEDIRHRLNQDFERQVNEVNSLAQSLADVNARARTMTGATGIPPNDVLDERDRLVRQVGTLGDEIRYAHGIAALGYEAAHLFLCYD